MVSLVFDHRAQPFPGRDSNAIRRPAIGIQVAQERDDFERFAMQCFAEGDDLIVAGSELSAAAGEILAERAKISFAQLFFVQSFFVQSGKPSRTAWAAAIHRAAHQILEHGCIFNDPLALPILGEDGDAVAHETAADPSSQRMRIFIAVRARFAEDALAAAVERGVQQVVVLGAGLDTYAYRNPFGESLRIFEVDHPATQAWKRERLRDASIPLPSSLTFAPVDFECQSLAEGLEAAHFDRTRQTFFTWLGVVPYLTEEAIWSTLAFIAGLPNGAHVVFDYSDPPDALSPEARAFHDQRAARVEAAGETWINYFEFDTLRSKLLALGFSEVEDLGPPQIAARYFPTRAGKVPEKGGHILRTTTIRFADE